MIKQWPGNHRMKHAAAHVLDHLTKRDWRLHFNVQLPQIFAVGIVGVLDDRGICPGRRRTPAMSHHTDAAHLLANWLKRAENAFHRAPTEPVVTHVIHSVLFADEIQWNFPLWIVSVEKERLDIGAKGVERRLVNFVGQTVAQLDPTPALYGGRMVVITDDADRLVIL